MIPRIPVHNIVNSLDADAVAPRQINLTESRLRCLVVADGSHVISTEFCSTSALTAHCYMSSLLDHIGNVGGLGAREEVPPVIAGRVVAGVQHPMPFRDRPDIQAIRDTVGSIQFARAIRDDPVAVIVAESHPQPARIWATRSIHLTRPSLSQRLSGLRFCSTRRGTESTVPCLNLVGAGLESSPAALTNAVNKCLHNDIIPYSHALWNKRVTGWDAVSGRFE